MNKIEHIVYVMFENRSLDNVLGWLYDDKKNSPKQFLPSSPNAVYNGLRTGNYHNFNKNGKYFPVKKVTDGKWNIPNHDPHEKFEHVNNQLFETGSKFPNNPKDGQKATMGGFYKDYDRLWESADQIMQTYTPEMLPVINGLAKQFAVSDAYYSSLPTQTNCNRAFAATGNSLGLDKDGKLTAWVNNHFGSLWPPSIWKLKVSFNQRTIWNVLSANGMGTPNDWMIYYSEIWDDFCYTRDLLDQIQGTEFDSNFANIDTFFAQAEAGNLPKFSFLEPEWGLKILGMGHNGNDYHPPYNLVQGEKFLNRIYNSLKANKEAWEKILLIINFDEHGGTYDHQAPPWGKRAKNDSSKWAMQPWSNPDDGTPTPAAYECDFKFNRYGVRVPLVLVSPYIPEGLVFRPSEGYFDHTSVIASILKKMGVPQKDWKLGSRVAQAPTFEDVICLENPRSNPPNFSPPTSSVEESTVDPPFNDLQAGIANNVLQFATQKKSLQLEALKELHQEHFNDEVKTVSQLSKALNTALNTALKSM